MQMGKQNDSPLDHKPPSPSIEPQPPYQPTYFSDYD